MTALAKFRAQVQTARELGHFVVQTADEAQALLAELEHPQPAGAHLRCERCGTDRTIQFNYATASVPPHDGDDVHHD